MTDRTSTDPLSLLVGRFAESFELKNVSDEGVLRAKLSILDAVGVALASTRYDFAHKLLSSLASITDSSVSPVIGIPTRLGVRDSMLMNGALIHGIDFDDSHNWAAFHPTASALTCALGAVCQAGGTGKDLLSAYIVAVEVMIRVGGAASGWFQPAGFHPTGYAGAFGCAVGAGWVLGLNAAQQADAQGIVLSAASGSMEFLAEGAWTKRLHPGQAAVAGYQAAHFARQGFVGPRLPYEGRFGLYRMCFGERADQVDFEAIAEGLGSRWEVEHMAVKPYPACHYTHSCADAIFKMMHDGLTASDVERVTVRVPQAEMPIVCEPIDRKRRPLTGYEAKFSIPYTVALCLTTGRHGLAEFDDDALLHRADVLSLCDRVECEVDVKADFPRHFSSDVEVLLKNGQKLHHREELNRGCVDRPLSPSDIEAKFLDNARLVLSEPAVMGLMDRVRNLERIDHTPTLASVFSDPGIVCRSRFTD